MKLVYQVYLPLIRHLECYLCIHSCIDHLKGKFILNLFSFCTHQVQLLCLIVIPYVHNKIIVCVHPSESPDNTIDTVVFILLSAFRFFALSVFFNSWFDMNFVWLLMEIIIQYICLRITRPWIGIIHHIQLSFCTLKILSLIRLIVIFKIINGCVIRLNV